MSVMLRQRENTGKSSSLMFPIWYSGKLKMRKIQLVLKTDSSSSSENSTNSAFTMRTVRYKECQKNHAASVGGYAVDGCREFMPSGEEGTNNAFICAACGCHRNFHRREVENEVVSECSSSPSSYTT
ncbi:hypothetical protein RND71_019693 [Anisodus tanguticus]|uniref:ZF-HD dimerization-type domain-containing protein n=1 Tax=Anisodus tanguticus TaxID=243964 RepID=A0AAE1S1A5_9SOLA|nr:hypothetical protein RND71_019693 [Anisodus tanguticus]